MIRGDDVVNVDFDICSELMDTAINMGCFRAVKFLQRSLNVLNYKGSLYADIKIDGINGSETLRALHEYLQHKRRDNILKAMNCLQGSFYIELAERREKDETFINGWLSQRVKL